MKQKILKSLLISLMIMVLPFAVDANEAGNEPTIQDEIGDDPNDWGRLPSQDTRIIEEDKSKETETGIDDDIGSGGYHSPSLSTDKNDSLDSGAIDRGTGGGLTGSGATGAWKKGLDKAGAQGLPDGAISDIIFNLASWLLLILGSFALIGFAISGILYLTSAGEEDRMEKAKKGMIYSIIGVIVGLLGYIIVQAVDTWFWGNDFF